MTVYSMNLYFSENINEYGKWLHIHYSITRQVTRILLWWKCTGYFSIESYLYFVSTTNNNSILKIVTLIEKIKNFPLFLVNTN